MSADPALTPRERAVFAVLLPLGVGAAVVAALLPLTRVVLPGQWLPGTIIVVTLVLAAGFLARLGGLAALAVTLIETGVWAAVVMLLFLRDTALVWLIPTGDTVDELMRLLATAAEEITYGAAPLRAGPALAFLIVASVGLLTVVIDHVVVTARMPLLAGVALVAVSLIPSIVVPDELDVVAFVLLAASILFLLRVDTLSRQTPSARASTRTAGIPATAVGIGAVAVVVSLIVTPSLPQPIARAAPGGVNVGSGIDATLQLGDDLRRPREVEVLRVYSTSPLPPYLRATTLSAFDGAVWLPDEDETRALSEEAAMDRVSVPAEVRLEEYSTSVAIENLSSTWLPMPFPAVDVAGLEGEWSTVPYNRTVISERARTQDQDYEVTTQVARPTREQIRTYDAAAPGMRPELTQLPGDLPDIVGDLAREVTEGSANDYDALIALQAWFRGSEFRYSLDAPVDDGFDGTGAEAVATFLEQKEGYCVHFAGAFALMARALDMPSRIVVGYLPGTSTTDAIDGQTVYSVSSSQLHAWPEIHFDGLGWISFEPTNSLGTPTNFSAETSLTGPAADRGDTTDTEDAESTPTPTLLPEEQEQQQNGEAAGSTGGSADGLPAIGVVIALLLLLAAPAILRAARARRLLDAARAGDVAAAWLVVQDSAIDLGIPVPASDSPRVLAARLTTAHGAPPGAMATLADAVERASYAPDGVVPTADADALADAAAEAAATLVRTAPIARRILAIAAPRSLIVRPGSSFAGAGARGRA
ncbi:DUF3488 and transglutaminase-like domain-containing protein [Microbacterium sp. SSW1-59]|uniref:transglutaminase TgpA family protein n=1 Tax=Microbacterium xanthum TaxID=3079794 RepID=UPI002AD4A29C|nr:DUF3488 and transglutaminase-like domain-containing protein [Microbacterium sp. SSW1-59]MDZ8200037.1 DUF3488 and transglutaminase-like domain-containing protein [Microbacterium sp. SSW1-59]